MYDLLTIFFKSISQTTQLYRFTAFLNDAYLLIWVGIGERSNFLRKTVKAIFVRKFEFSYRELRYLTTILCLSRHKTPALHLSLFSIIYLIFSLSCYLSTIFNINFMNCKQPKKKQNKPNELKKKKNTYALNRINIRKSVWGR